ncbi:hypothetical protein glysoja_014920 [Glycine soja]|nr:hypothetical protein glysoja_014920 [Glycine soja]
MARSRSVAVTAVTVVCSDGEFRPRTKGRGWFFPSPMKAFRQSKYGLDYVLRDPNALQFSREC